MFSSTIHKFLSFLLLSFVLVVSGCKDDNDPAPTPDPDLEAERTHEFVWEAMNSWYYFKNDVDELSDSFNDNSTNYINFLNSYEGPEDLFESFLVGADPYSYIVADYDELGSSLEAFYDDFGYDFGLIQITGSENVLGYVRFVFEGSGAAEAGLERGSFFTEVDGTELTTTNFFDLLIEADSYELGMVDIVEQEQDGEITLVIEDNGETIAVEAEEFEGRSPIWVEKTIDLPNGKTVGYLSYSNFASDFHSELNQVFGNFQAEGVTDLVLDLRYNPGGSVLTALYLNSMIHSTENGKLMGSIQYNNQQSANNGNLFFTDEIEIKNEDFDSIGTEMINSLGLNELYVITSNSTASASEFVINALNPYVNVQLIGETTVGKNLGSISLYDDPDSDYTEKEDANTEHTYGLQPIVSKIFNSQNQSDYDEGFPADIEDHELNYLPDLPALGDENEPLLARALSELCTGCRTIDVTDRKKHNMNIRVIGEKMEGAKNYQVLDITGLQ